MNADQLQQLLTQNESLTLDFKRKPHQIDASDQAVRSKQRDELIKDILSLANGNAATVDQKGYLVIGADDKLQADGSRMLYDADPAGWSPQRILQLVNSACAPPLHDIEVEMVEVNDKRIIVITVWPTPHLHETTRELITPQAMFNKHVVFIRHSENIGIASVRERDAIAKLKQVHSTDTKKAPPVKFGALVGGIVGAFMVGAAVSQDKSNLPSRTELARKLFAGSILGTPLGMLIGWIFSGFVEVKYEWHFLSNRKRLALFSIGLIYISASWKILTTLWSVLVPYVSKTNPSTDHQPN